MRKYLLIALAGVFAQFIDGTLGMGYGVTSSTLLISMGFYPVIVSASVHAAEVFVIFVSGISHLKFGNLQKDIFVPLTLFGVIGGILGAYGMVNLPISAVKFFVSTTLLVLGCVIFHKSINGNMNKIKEKILAKKLSPLGFLAGFVDAVGGGGWGPICTPVFIINGTEPRKAIGTVNLAEFFVTLSITITFVLLIGIEKFQWDMVAVLILAGMAIAPIAAYLCRRFSPNALGILVGLLIIVLNVCSLFKLFS